MFTSILSTSVHLETRGCSKDIIQQQSLMGRCGILEQHSLSLAIEVQKQLTYLILLSSKFLNTISSLNYFLELTKKKKNRKR